MSAEDVLRAAIDAKLAEHPDLVAEYKELFDDEAVAEQWIAHEVSESSEIAGLDQELGEELGLVEAFREVPDDDFDTEAFLSEDIECDDGDVELVG